MESIYSSERESEEHEHYFAIDLTTSLKVHDGEALEKTRKNYSKAN